MVIFFFGLFLVINQNIRYTITDIVSNNTLLYSVIVRSFFKHVFFLFVYLLRHNKYYTWKARGFTLYIVRVSKNVRKNLLLLLLLRFRLLFIFAFKINHCFTAPFYFCLPFTSYKKDIILTEYLSNARQKAHLSSNSSRWRHNLGSL